MGERYKMIIKKTSFQGLLKLTLPILVILAMLLPVLPMGVASAITAPTVVTTAATSITANSGTLNGNVTATGGENPNVWIVWYQGSYDRYPIFPTDPYIDRNNDLDEWIAYFQNSVDLGTKPVGAVSLAIGNLTQERVYWRLVARNSTGLDITATAYFDPTPPVPYYEWLPADWDSTCAVSTGVNQAVTWVADGNISLAAIAFFGQQTGRVVTFDLKAVDGAHKPTGAVLATTTMTTVVNWNRGDLTTPYNLISGTEYAFIVRRSGGSFDWTVYGKKTSGLNADCLMWTTINSGATWQSPTDYYGYDADLAIRLYTVTGIYRVASANILPLADSDITETTATLRGYVEVLFDQSYSASFEYGTTTAYGSTSAPPTTIYGAGAISAGITGLTAGTLYHYRVKSVGTLGNFTGYSSDGTFYTPDYSEEGYTVSTGLGSSYDYQVQIPNQRKSFYAQGRYWVFYVDTTGYLSYKSSTDGQTFGTVNVANGVFTLDSYNDSQFSLTFDGTNVHFVTGRRDYPLSYRMGTPQSNGIISWDDAGLQENIGASEAGFLYTAPYVTTDASGYPWVFVGSCSYSGDLNVEVFRSSTKDGTWTTASGYPKTPFTDLSLRYWQRGIILPFDNGDMYFIAGRRAFEFSSNLIEHNGSEKLKGFKYTASTNSFSAPVYITTTEMDWIGDVNAAPYALFTATSWGDYGYLAFTNTNNDLKFLVYNNQLGTWSSETTLETDLARRTAPAITVHDVDGRLYLFWIVGRTLYYRWRNNTGVWSGTPTAIVTENLMSNVANINTWEHSVEGKTAIMYRTSEDTQQGYRQSQHYTMPQMNAAYYDIKFVTMSTGFSVGTDIPANIASTSVTLQGHLVNDGNESCQVRFEWGLTSAYGSTTTWQSGFNTGQTFNQALTGLTANTVYHFRAIARHADLSTVNGADLSFTTTTLGAPTVTTNNVVSKTDTGGWLEGTLTSLGEYSSVSVFFEYGLTAGYGSATTLQTMAVTGSFPTFVTGLASNTLYHYKAAVQYNGTNYVYGVDKTFTTMAATNPLVYTGIASAISNTGATLQGTLQSLGSYTPVYVFFQYGTTTSYSSATTEQTQTSVVGYNQALSGLTSETTYHFRAGVRYNVSSYAYGSDGTFTTLTSAPISGEPGIDPPDIMSLVSVKVFKNYLVTGDQLFVVAYKLLYNAGNPVADSSDYFDLRLFDGSISKAKTSVKQWGYKPGSIYLAPGSTVTWKGAYSIQLVANISKWVSPPATITRTITAGDWMGSDLLGLDTWVLSTAESLQSYYSSQLLIYPAGGATKVLNDEGSIIFNTGIPGLSTVRPHLFSAYITYPNLTPEGNAAAQSYEATLKAQRTIRLGPYISNYIDSISTLFGGLVSAEQVGGVFLVLIYLLLALTIGALAGNMLWGLSTSVLVIIPGVYFALISPTFVALMIFISGALFVYEVWWKQASA